MFFFQSTKLGKKRLTKATQIDTAKKRKNGNSEERTDKKFIGAYSN